MLWARGENLQYSWAKWIRSYEITLQLEDGVYREPSQEPRLRGLSPEFGLLKENSRKRTKMPTEQEAKPAVVTPSLQQWRSPSTFRGAPGEDPLKWLKEQWYVNNEDALDSWEAFKNGLSGLFGDHQRYTRRAEEQLKCRAQRSGPVDEKINDTASFIKWCNYIEDMKQKRVGRPRFERLPNVVPVASLTDETDLVSLICTIVREEVHRLVNQTQESLDSDPQSLEEIVQDEVERVLAPVSTKTYRN
ncbi:retrotrans_gag domain-containing protein [Trichonephila clavipes]|nr:retrotrans_gag domain-containing protein [Trichonephila clavipes]